MKLVDLMDKRLDYLKMNKSNDYYEENKRYFKKALSLWGSDLNVEEITRKDVNDLLMAEARRCKKIGKSNYKVNAMLRCMKALFNYGIRVYEMQIANPCIGIEFYPVTVHLKYIPSDEDIEAIRALCVPEQLMLFDFVEETGCRIMEAIRLTSADIDGELATLWTRKSKNSNLTPRRIPLPKCLKDYKIPKEPERVFKIWGDIPRFLEDKVKKLNQKKWSWHNLRHRRASIWATNGMNTFEIMVRLGHSNLQTTMNYLQLLGFTRW